MARAVGSGVDSIVIVDGETHTDLVVGETVLMTVLDGDAFNAGGVEIMSPRYAALRDGNRTTIPADALPRTYEAPAFRVSLGDGKS